MSIKYKLHLLQFYNLVFSQIDNCKAEIMFGTFFLNESITNL